MHSSCRPVNHRWHYAVQCASAGKLAASCQAPAKAHAGGCHVLAWNRGVRAAAASHSSAALATASSSRTMQQPADMTTSLGAAAAAAPPAAGLGTRRMQQTTALLAAGPAEALQPWSSAAIRCQALFACSIAAMGVMAATASSSDWHQDAALFAGVFGMLWTISCWRPFQLAPQLLMVMLPLPHMAGCWGTYHWSLGNLSWDILVHIWGGCTGTLLAHAVVNGNLFERSSLQAQPTTTSAAAGGKGPLADLPGLPAGIAAGNSSSGTGGIVPSGMPLWKVFGPMGRTLVALVLLLGVTTTVEVLEGSEGPLLGHHVAQASATPAGVLASLPQGEGLFKPGPGDFCLEAAPCSNQEDTAKDMVDNAAGAVLALAALQYSHLATAGNAGATSEDAGV